MGPTSLTQWLGRTSKGRPYDRSRPTTETTVIIEVEVPPPPRRRWTRPSLLGGGLGEGTRRLGGLGTNRGEKAESEPPQRNSHTEKSLRSTPTPSSLHRLPWCSSLSTNPERFGTGWGWTRWEFPTREEYPKEPTTKTPLWSTIDARLLPTFIPLTVFWCRWPTISPAGSLRRTPQQRTGVLTPRDTEKPCVFVTLDVGRKGSRDTVVWVRGPWRMNLESSRSWPSRPSTEEGTRTRTPSCPSSRTRSVGKRGTP